MRPGITKSTTLTDAWQRIATVYDPAMTTKINPGGENSDGVMITITSNKAQIALSESTPTCLGHLLDDGSTLTGSHYEWIRLGWVRNHVAGSNAVIIITPLYHT